MQFLPTGFGCNVNIIEAGIRSDKEPSCNFIIITTTVYNNITKTLL